MHIHKGGCYLGGRLVSVKSLPNSLPYSRWAVITSKKLGKAVVRNRVKRRLREIMRQASLEPGKDIILMIRTGAVTASFRSLQENTFSLLIKAGIIKHNEINCSATD